ncbi:hypothetical protein ACFLVC_02880 [Chloroflexota bacterium]
MISNKTLKLLISVFVLAGILLGMFAVPVKAGTPGIDFYKIERYYLEANTAANATTQSTSPVTAANLTFTPSGNTTNKTFLILASALTNNSAETATTSVELNIDGAVYSTVNHSAARVSNNWRSWATHKVIEVPNGSPVSAAIQFFTSVGTETAYVQWTTLAALEISTENTYTSENNSSHTTDLKDPNYQNSVNLTFTPTAGDYLLLATAVSRNSAGKEAYVRLTSADVHSPVITGETWGSWAVAENHTLSNTQYTFKIDYATGSTGGTAELRDSRLTAVLLSDLGSWNSTATEGEGSTISDTYIDYATLTYSPANQGDWIVLASGLGKQAINNNQYYAKLNIDDTTDLGEYIFESEGRNIYRSFMMLRKVNLSSGSHDINLMHKQGGSEIFSKEFFITAIKADAVESYNDVALETIENNYSAGQNPYIRVHGLRPSNTYAVGYYDGSGEKIETDTKTSSSTGNLSSLINLVSGSYVSSTPGDWHAVVFDTTYGSPSANYSVATTTKSTNGYVTEDIFNVPASAIPEFPSIIAAVVVIGTCFAIYISMRKKRLAYVHIQD